MLKANLHKTIHVNNFNSIILSAVLYASKTLDLYEKGRTKTDYDSGLWKDPCWEYHCVSTSEMRWFRSTMKWKTWLLSTKRKISAGPNKLKGSQTHAICNSIWNWKTFMTMGRCQVIWDNIEWEGEIKDKMEVPCGQQFGKHQTAWPIRDFSIRLDMYL